mmetsp:Transcript_33056/g.112218  ORF Transcript_33056/g.112218 Transcript_33056/m.112218 type:complete len:687 (-) Transcript_33056:896-2956(-)
MADPVIFIVGKLNEYFKSNLTLVDFDEKSQVELIQILNDVLAELDGSIKADVRDEPREARVAKIVQLLVVLKYPPLKSAHDDDREAVERGLAVGEKSAIYPILHWLLDRLPQHKKRAYVARFLYPVDVPQEFMQDEVLAECYNHYKHLQGEFKRAHQAVEKTRQTPIHPVEMKQEIATLEEEKKQLHQKIDKLKRQNDDVHDFHKLLAATNNLRLQQDEDARLGDNMRKQKVALQGAEQRKKDALKRLNGLRNSTSASADAHMLLEQLQSEVQQLTQRVQHELPRELEQKREKLARMTEARFEPQRTADDVDEMNRNIMDDQSRIASLRKRIDQTVADRNDTKLANFKQHATMISRKLSDKENELEKLEGEHAKVTKEIEQQETLMTELGGAKFMTRDEFKKFGNQLREKTHVYKKLKAELGELRAESVTLHRTEQILRGRVANLEVFLTELEARRGVRGYRDTQDKLERASEQTAEADAMKEKTLEEISNMVRSITQQLKEKKNDLAPQIKKLREVRNSYQIVETDFLQKKATYDKVAVGLDVERQQLEHECDAYQEEALQKESRFHYLNCLTSMAEATLKRIDDEEGWKAGKGRGLLPNFKCYEDLYTNKLAQQQAFSDQLRKQRATIEKHEGPNMKQRAVYADLEKLLAFKLKIVEDDTAGQMGFASTEYDLGNARVAQFSTL